MAQRFDVPARLAEGRDAVRHTGIYVAACRRLGYLHPDLTGYGGQVGDWYDGEEGLDLHLLDGDCAQLWALADAAEGVLRAQCAQLGELAAAWRGPGADAAAEFLRRHCDAGAAVTARLAATARAAETLRDELWRLIDDKAATVIGIDDRVAGQRPAWLAAAHAVTVGTGDRQAEDIVEHRVMPYVDNDIGGEWVSAMRSSRTAVSAAYDAATTAVEPGPGVVFGIPAELGRWARVEPPLSAGAQIPAVTAMAVPPAPSEPVATVPAAPATGGAPVAAEGGGPPADLGAPGGVGLPAGTGLPDIGALGGLLPRLGSALGSLLGSSGAGFGGPFDGLSAADHPDDPAGDEVADEVADEAPEAATEAAADETPDQADSQPDNSEPVAGDASGDESDEPGQEIAADGPGPYGVPADPASPPAQQAGEVTPEPAGKTPCEIAADALPQVGQ